MFRRKFIRLGSALLMILALTLPVFTESASAVTAVTSVTPSSGGSGGGTAVTIAGTGFAALGPGCTPANWTTVTTVTFDIAGTPAVATGVTVVSDTSITATTATHAAGAPVSVTVAQGVPAAPAC